MAKIANRKVGRPSDYSEEKLEKAKDYVINHEIYGDVVPTAVGLAEHLDQHLDTLYEWAKYEDRKEFSDTLRRVQQKQHSKLVNGGLSGVLNQTITKLMLSNHGYSEKSTVEQHNYLHEDSLDDLK
jgi:hypothetical protein